MSLHTHTAKVLLVDDHPLVLESIRQLLDRLLRLHGFRTESVATVAQALDVTERAPVAAVILDLTLAGGESGLQLLAALRSRPAHVATPVLVLTGHLALPEDDEQMIRRYSAFVFYKNQPLDALIDYVRRLTGCA